MHGIEYKLDGDRLIVTIDVSKKAIDAAPPSRGGNTCLVASTGAALPIDSKHARDLRLQINLMVKK